MGYGFDSRSGITVGFQMLPECCHESLEVAQLRRIVTVQSDHPFYRCFLQRHGHAMNLGPLAGLALNLACRSILGLGKIPSAWGLH